MALMSSGGGLSNGKLGLATATPEDAISGKTFYSGDSDSVTIYYTSTRSFHFLSTTYSGQRWTVSSSAITGRASISGSIMIIQNNGFSSSTWAFTSNQNFVVYRIDVSDITGATFPL